MQEPQGTGMKGRASNERRERDGGKEGGENAQIDDLQLTLAIPSYMPQAWLQFGLDWDV